MNLRFCLIVFAVWLLPVATANSNEPAAGTPLADRADVRAFMARMSETHGFDGDALRTLFQQASMQPEILDAIQRPWEAKPWHAYRPIFVTESRIADGVQFWRSHASLLEAAQAQFGVPPEIIVAIIGVETRYGQFTGRHRVVEALATLGFGYPPRGDFFLRELEQFLLLSREEQLDATGIRGSYAGAIGWPQFIPSSYRAYAVDFDQDGRRDLLSSPADIIGSVANYFHRHGWTLGSPIATPALVNGNGRALGNRNRDLPYTLAKLRQQGVSFESQLPDSAPANLIALEQPSELEYWVGFPNFYVITRYNHSVHYAMAVYQLSQRIREAYFAEA
ncbi:MAG: lytic murein transglycosylase B [Pseudomonadota bacterium]|nr:lytic murein transglycosylase B [Pseudomonadota bacterium]